MRLDIKLLERKKEEVSIEKTSRSWCYLPLINVLELWPEVCRRYSEEVNKKPDTKTAEEIMNELNKKRAIKWDGLSDGGKWSRAIEAMHEYASPLKKRIEELEDMLHSTIGYFEYTTDSKQKIREIRELFKHLHQWKTRLIA